MNRKANLQLLANLANFRVTTLGEDTEAALKAATLTAMQDSSDVLSRVTGRELTEEQASEYRFMWSCAHDVQENIFRPSVGKSRDYVLSLMH